MVFWVISTFPGKEEPIPRRRILSQLLPAGKLLPGEEDLSEPFQRKAGALKAIAGLERLPEVLLQPAKAKLPKGDIVGLVFAMPCRVLARHLQRYAHLTGAIDHQHRVIMYCIHRR